MKKKVFINPAILKWFEIVRFKFWVVWLCDLNIFINYVIVKARILEIFILSIKLLLENKMCRSQVQYHFTFRTQIM